METLEGKMLSELRTDLIIKRREARREYKCQYSMASIYRSRHQLYGTTAIVLAVIAGSSFISEVIFKIPELKLIPSLFTMLSALFSGLITFNKYIELAQLNYNSGREWEKLRDEYATLILKLNAIFHDGQSLEIIQQYELLNERRTQLRNHAAVYPARIFKLYENIKDKAEIEEVI